MSDFSDLILLMGAMIAFSLLAVSTSLTYQSNSDAILTTELEYRAIATGQTIIDEMRWITDEDEFDPDRNDYYFKGFPVTRTITYGSSAQFSSNYTISGKSALVSSTADMNKYMVTVNVTNSEANNPVSITLQFVKSFYQ